MADQFAGVIRQLKEDNKTNTGVLTDIANTNEQTKLENREGMNKLIHAITGELGAVKDTFEEGQKQDQDQAQAGKKFKSAEVAKDNKMTRMFKGIAEGPKKLGTIFKNQIGGLVTSLKDKAKTGWAIAKKFLLLGALGMVLQFLESDMWKKLKEDIMPALSKAFEAVTTTLTDIFDSFWDEEGNFTAIGGLKAIVQKIWDGFKSLGSWITDSFSGEGGVWSFDNWKDALGKIAITIGGIGLGWMLLGGSLKGFLKLLNPFKFFGGMISTGRRGGQLFSSAMTGIKSGWKGLGGAMSGFKNSLSTMATGMSDYMTKARRSGGWASSGVGGMKGRFGRLMGMMGKGRGKKLGLLGLVLGAGVGMAAMLNTETVSGIFSAGKNGLTKAFNGAFDVMKNFGSSIKNVVGAAAGKMKTVVADTKNKIAGADEPDKKPKKVTKAEMDANKKKMSAMDKIRNADAAAIKADLLKKEKARLAEIEKQKGLDKGKMKVSLDNAKLQKSLLKNAGKLGLKMLPAIGALYGIWETGRRGLQGDWAGMMLEGGAVFAPSAFGLPADAALMASDTYYDMFGTRYAKDLKNDPAKANAQMGQIASVVKAHITGTETAKKGETITPTNEAGRGSIYNTYNTVGGSSKSISQTFTTQGLVDNHGPGSSNWNNFE